MKVLKKLINAIPYILIIYIFSGIPLLALISVFKFDNTWNFFLNLCHLLFFLVSSLIFKRFSKIFVVDDFKKYNWVLLFFALILILYRFPVYFHALDDYVLHMVDGYFSLNVWSNKNFLPMSMFTYLYPLLQVAFYPLISLIGIRLTVLFLSLSQLIWFLSLNYRFGKLFIGKNKSSFLYLNFFFIFLYFLPELVLTHTLFMSDFYTVLFSLEIVYLFLSRTGSKEFMIFLMIIGLLTKQSSGLFLIIFFSFFLFKDFKQIKKGNWLWLIFIVVLVLIYCVVNYIETGNPLAFLLNGFFKSPLYNFFSERDMRWGPVGWKQIFIWPLIAFFNSRYIEWIILKFPEKIIFSSFLVIPYLISFFGILFSKKRFIYGLCFLSILFWSWQSGYGRYQIAMTSIIWILLINQLIGLLPRVKTIFASIILMFIFSSFCFISIENDYALRSFILGEFWPPKIDTYSKNKYLEGLALIGHDRYIDMFQSIKKNFDGYKQIVVVNRGGSTFYAFLANMYTHIPLRSSIEIEQKNKILFSDKVSQNIKDNVSSLYTDSPILLVADLDFESQLKSSWFYLSMDCHKLNRDKTVPQFEHEHYFNYVEEYDCR